MQADLSIADGFEPAQHPVAGCELCHQPAGRLVARLPGWRVVRVDDEAFPAFYRLICREHVSEMSDLSSAEQRRCLAWMMAIEAVLRRELAPAKINLASLGNVVPHLHWHVIARFGWDSHFPQPVWGQRQRSVEDSVLELVRERLPAVDRALAAALREVP
ncbi:MAG: HIT family protein [Caldimonas sp.]|uniref:HIT family protein n=1 Tax=Caldimonas sp. TaxID=2838790 RepID=UPI00391C3BCC